MNILLAKRHQQQIIEQAKFTYSPLGKAFKKQTKTIEDQGKKQLDTLESLRPSDKKLPSIKDFIAIENQNPETINEIKRIEEEEKKVDRNKMVYKATRKIYDFRKFKTIHAFGNKIRNNVINEDMANDEQNELINYIEKFSRSTRPNDPESKKLKKEVLDSVIALLQEEKWYLQHLKAEYFRGLKNHKRVKDLKYQHLIKCLKCYQ